MLYDDPDEPEVTEPDEYPYPDDDWDKEDEEDYRDVWDIDD